MGGGVGEEDNIEFAGEGGLDGEDFAEGFGFLCFVVHSIGGDFDLLKSEKEGGIVRVGRPRHLHDVL